MKVFVVLSVALHLVVFYTNIHQKVKSNFERIGDTKKAKITILKERDIPMQEFSIDKIEPLKSRFSYFKREPEKELFLLDKKEEPVKQKTDMISNFPKQTAKLNIPPSYLVPVYSSQKLDRARRNETEVKENSNANLITTGVASHDSNLYKIKGDIGKKVNNGNDSEEKFKQYVQLYRDEVFTIVYRKFEKYAKNKKFRNKNDTVILNVSINQSGKILNIDIKEASGDDKFNKLCVDVIKEIAKFPPFPRVLDVEVIKLTIPFRIKLP